MTNSLNIKFGAKNANVQIKEKIVTVNRKQEIKKEENFTLVERKGVKSKKSTLALLSTTLPLILTASPTHAMGKHIQEIANNEVIQMLIEGAVITGLGAVLVGMASSGVIAITAIFNMNKAKEWTIGVLKATGLVAFLPTTITTIVFLGHLMFGGSQFYTIDLWDYFVPAFQNFLK